VVVERELSSSKSVECPSAVESSVFFAGIECSVMHIHWICYCVEVFI